MFGNEYCGFLDLSMDEFVQIQNRLMEGVRTNCLMVIVEAH